jgi:hypothetical protein
MPPAPHADGTITIGPPSPYATQEELHGLRTEVRAGFSEINEQLRSMQRPQYNLLVSAGSAVLVMVGLAGALVGQNIGSEAALRKKGDESLQRAMVAQADSIQSSVEVAQEANRRSREAMADLFAAELDGVWSGIADVRSREVEREHVGRYIDELRESSRRREAEIARRYDEQMASEHKAWRSEISADVRSLLSSGAAALGPPAKE